MGCIYLYLSDQLSLRVWCTWCYVFSRFRPTGLMWVRYRYKYAVITTWCNTSTVIVRGTAALGGNRCPFCWPQQRNMTGNNLCPWEKFLNYLFLSYSLIILFKKWWKILCWKYKKKRKEFFKRTIKKQFKKGCIISTNLRMFILFNFFFCFVIYFQRLQVIIKDSVLVVSCDRFRWFWRLLFHFVCAVSDPLIS